MFLPQTHTTRLRLHDRSKRIEAGFTLFELLIIMVIAMILASFAVPSFSEVYRNQKLSSHISEFANAHRLARSEAVTRGKTVAVCKSSNATSATPSCGGGSVDWEDGWIVFQNDDDDAPAVVDAGEEILRLSAALPATLTLRGESIVNTDVAYRATGEVQTPGLIILCDAGDLNHARAIFVGTSGRIRIANINNSGTPVDDTGAALTSCSPP